MPFATAIGTWLGASTATATAAGVAAYSIAATAASMAMQAKAASDAGKNEEKWQKYNAAISEQEAEAAKQSALHGEKAHRKAGKRHLSRMLVEGYDPLMLEETAGELEKDAMMIRRGGVMGEQKLKSTATIARGKGAFARRAGRWRSGATLLSGGAKMTSQYGSYKGYW